MKSVIKQDSYWFVDGEGHTARMRALCPICSKKTGRGWYWAGSSLGYGDYDLFCADCGNAIHIRGEDEIETCDKGR